ncbi:MAG: AI-2E family transporter [Acidobacteriota bacterium]
MTGKRQDPRGLIAYAITASLAGIVGLYAAYLLRDILLLLYVAGLLAIGISPSVRWIERRSEGRRLPRWIAILFIYLGLLGVAAITLMLVVPPLVTQATDLWTNLPAYADSVQKKLLQYRLITHTYSWSEILRQAPNPGIALVGVLGALQGILGALGALITVLVLPYYLLLEAPALQVTFVKFFAREHRPLLARVIHNVTNKVSAWLSGQLILSVIIGTTAALGLWLLGVPYFYVLALVAGIGELIPVVGPILAAIPAILVALTVSPQTAAFTILYFSAQQFIENHFLVPRVMERQVGVSPVTVISALLIGSELLGIVGALLAVPTAAIVQVLVHEWLDRESRDSR